MHVDIIAQRYTSSSPDTRNTSIIRFIKVHTTIVLSFESVRVALCSVGSHCQSERRKKRTRKTGKTQNENELSQGRKKPKK